MYGEEIKIDKFKVLLQAYRYLAKELRYANTPLRNQTKYFNRLFDDYRGTEKEDKNLTDEEKVLLSLFNSKNFNPLNILKQNQKKYPEHFSYSSIIEEVNKELASDIEKILNSYVYLKDAKSISSQIAGMTSLMSFAEINILYTRLVNKDLNRNGEECEVIIFITLLKHIFLNLKRYNMYLLMLLV